MDFAPTYCPVVRRLNPAGTPNTGRPDARRPHHGHNTEELRRAPTGLDAGSRRPPQGRRRNAGPGTSHPDPSRRASAGLALERLPIDLERRTTQRPPRPLPPDPRPRRRRHDLQEVRRPLHRRHLRHPPRRVPRAKMDLRTHPRRRRRQTCRARPARSHRRCHRHPITDALRVSRLLDQGSRRAETSSDNRLEVPHRHRVVSAPRAGNPTPRQAHRRGRAEVPELAPSDRRLGSEAPDDPRSPQLGPRPRRPRGTHPPQRRSAHHAARRAPRTPDRMDRRTGTHLPGSRDRRSGLPGTRPRLRHAPRRDRRPPSRPAPASEDSHWRPSHVPRSPPIELTRPGNAPPQHRNGTRPATSSPPVQVGPSSRATSRGPSTASSQPRVSPDRVPRSPPHRRPC